MCIYILFRRREEERIREMISQLESERLARRIAEENLSTTDKGYILIS